MKHINKSLGLFAAVALSACYMGNAYAYDITTTASVGTIYQVGAVGTSLTLNPITQQNFASADSANLAFPIGTNGGRVTLTAAASGGGTLNSNGTLSFTSMPNIQWSLSFTGCQGSAQTFTSSQLQVTPSSIPLSCAGAGSAAKLTVQRSAINANQVPDTNTTGSFTLSVSVSAV